MQVLRLNVMDDGGGDLAMRYGVRGAPAFVLLNSAEEVVLKQAGVPDRDEVRVTMAALSGE